MRFLFYLAVSLTIILASHNIPSVMSQIPVNQNIGDFNTPIKSISIVADLPWSDSGIQEPITRYVSDSVNYLYRVRKVPSILQTDNGEIWLHLDKNLMFKKEDNSWQIINLEKIKIEYLDSIAPLTDGKIILLGSQDNKNVLAAIDRNGKLLWQRHGIRDKNQLNLPLLQGIFYRLLVNTDGSVYLPGTETSNKIAKIDPISGATSSVFDINENATEDIFIHDGELFYVIVKDGIRYWVRQSIKTGIVNKVRGCAELQELFPSVIGVLPDGGALIRESNFLVWMSPQGERLRKIRLSGIVRNDQDIFASVLIDDKIMVNHFRGDRIIDHDILELKFDYDIIKYRFQRAKLANANESEYDFLADNEIGMTYIVNINRQTKQPRFTAVSDDNLLNIASFVGVYDPVIIDSNTLLLSGADPKGTFVVRVELEEK